MDRRASGADEGVRPASASMTWPARPGRRIGAGRVIHPRWRRPAPPEVEASRGSAGDAGVAQAVSAGQRHQRQAVRALSDRDLATPPPTTATDTCRTCATRWVTLLAWATTPAPAAASTTRSGTVQRQPSPTVMTTRSSRRCMPRLIDQHHRRPESRRPVQPGHGSTVCSGETAGEPNALGARR